MPSHTRAKWKLLLAFGLIVGVMLQNHGTQVARAEETLTEQTCADVPCLADPAGLPFYIHNYEEGEGSTWLNPGNRFQPYALKDADFPQPPSTAYDGLLGRVRYEGADRLTYKGMMVYTYSDDLPGVPNGLEYARYGWKLAVVPNNAASNAMSRRDEEGLVDVYRAPDGTWYLTDPVGATLYKYARDTTGRSTCTVDCDPTNGPYFPYLTFDGDLADRFQRADSAPTMPYGFSGKIGIIKAGDGQWQVTHDGLPLYHFGEDTPWARASDLFGQDAPAGEHTRGNRPPNWSAVVVRRTAPAVAVSRGPSGDRLVTADTGRSIYSFANDRQDFSACTGGCTNTWIPLESSGNLQLPPGVGGTLSDFVRPGGGRQLTYNGRPLYRYSGDVARGQTNGIGQAGWSLTSAQPEPRQSGVKIWTSLADRPRRSGVYAIGDRIRVCFIVPGPGTITIIDEPPNSPPQQFLPATQNDGMGGCAPARITPPPGQECLRLTYVSRPGAQPLTSRTCFDVEEGRN